MIPVSAWVWCGYPGHFIGASSCRMHLNTRVGGYRISTVGDYRRGDGQQPQEIGSGRLYETMVFEVEGLGLHGEGEVTDWRGIDADWAWGAYQTAEEAEEGHMRICRAASREQS